MHSRTVRSAIQTAPDRSSIDGSVDQKVKPPLEFGILGEGGVKKDSSLDTVPSKDQGTKDQNVDTANSDTIKIPDTTKPMDQGKLPDQTTKSDLSSSVCSKCVPTNSGGITLQDINYGATVSDVPVTNGVRMTYTAGSPTNLTMGVSIKIDAMCVGIVSVTSSSLTLQMNSTPFDPVNTQSVTVKDSATGKSIKLDFSATLTGKGMQLTYRVSGC